MHHLKMKLTFKEVINVKSLRFAACMDVLEKWAYNIICILLERPLLTTFVVMTAIAIFFALLFILLVVFAGVICLTIIIMLIEGFVLVVIAGIIGLFTTVGLYFYLTVISIGVYFDKNIDFEEEDVTIPN